ncbi:DUF4433 domain-containing protein [Arcicella lustrica]|uniref:DUF4433 domain-containing protein n=1 Tax=Arcicella lustrica TaxID=2984196 RepID=A0ABU5SL00_9BACT|nr:DUF4433 domain-containing protein [Arcicella sp. DC25W]MEA5427972.1 DUF4433 domain-containing protein [Arcicella sp. DC25W]
MSNNLQYLEKYNQNIYISILKLLFSELSDVELFLQLISDKNDFKNIDDLEKKYNSIFTHDLITKHINFKIDKIHKALYLRTPETFDKGNSYFHLTLKLSSDEIIWLDDLYNSVLSKLIKFYKHLFSKIDNYFISFNSEQLVKYQSVLTEIKKEVEVFLEFSENREIVDKREKLNIQHLSKIPFGGLFYVCHIDNISSILKLGILSHNVAHKEGLVKNDISDQSVNSLRNRFEKSLGGNIHDFAPLFLHLRNSTFFRWCKSENKNNLILLKVNPHILLADNVAFSDGNAAVRTTRFYQNIDDFNKLNWQVIKDDYWTNYPDGKRIKCSEVLVQDKIPLYYVNELLVYSEETLAKILPLFPNHLGILTSINKQIYF